MGQLIERQRSVVVACDVPLSELPDLVLATRDVPGVGGYKLGIEAGLNPGLRAAVEVVKLRTRLPVIYDHQKAGNDIPEMGVKFARAVASSSVDAVILFPFTGRKTQEAWTKACQDRGLVVIVGGEMTHEGFFDYIREDAPRRIYAFAVELGVTDFVVPGNKPESVRQYRELLESMLGVGNFQLYAPGFINQGGDITETGKVAGKKWNAIVGSAIYGQNGVDAMRTATEKVTAQIIGVEEVAAE